MKKYYYHRYSTCYVIKDTIVNNNNETISYDYGLKFSKMYIVKLINPIIINMINRNLHVELKQTFKELVLNDITKIDKIQNKVYKK